MTTNRGGLDYELDHRYLVDEHRSMSDARNVLWRGLVQPARKAGLFAVFLWRGRGCGDLRVRVIDDPCSDSGAIPTVGTLDTCVGLGPHCLNHGGNSV